MKRFVSSFLKINIMFPSRLFCLLLAESNGSGNHSADGQSLRLHPSRSRRRLYRWERRFCTSFRDLVVSWCLNFIWCRRTAAFGANFKVVCGTLRWRRRRSKPFLLALLIVTFLIHLWFVHFFNIILSLNICCVYFIRGFFPLPNRWIPHSISCGIILQSKYCPRALCGPRYGVHRGVQGLVRPWPGFAWLLLHLGQLSRHGHLGKLLLLFFHECCELMLLMYLMYCNYRLWNSFKE